MQLLDRHESGLELVICHVYFLCNMYVDIDHIILMLTLVQHLEMTMLNLYLFQLPQLTIVKSEVLVM